MGRLYHRYDSLKRTEKIRSFRRRSRKRLDEFNVDPLRPTYRLKTGVPGKSNAFEISRKLGLSEELIDRASTLLERGDIEFEDVISAIEADKRKAEEERDEAVLLNVSMKKQKEFDNDRILLSQ